MNELGTYIVIFSLLALYHSEFRFLLEPFAFFSGDLLFNNWKFIFLGFEVKMSFDHWLLINDHWSLFIVQWTMFMSRYLLFMNYYSFLAGFKIKRFFDWCGEQDLPFDDDNKDNHDKYHDGNNNDNNYEKYHTDKDSKPDIPVDTCYPVYALRMPRFNRVWYTYDYDFECDNVFFLLQSWTSFR